MANSRVFEDLTNSLNSPKDQLNKNASLYFEKRLIQCGISWISFNLEDIILPRIKRIEEIHNTVNSGRKTAPTQKININQKVPKPRKTNEQYRYFDAITWFFRESVIRDFVIKPTEYPTDSDNNEFKRKQTKYKNNLYVYR
ncbi:35496_t:CDS:2 [Gigaspora margarita]|uniref:35496_t:CDS:1 n=1 Tax=Gigaspora margarita TaxID=4874 RepID=A0ABM8VW20_GIGMA|nr:35496_t:CDS:2 [Gigaspora margarita]